MIAHAADFASTNFHIIETCSLQQTSTHNEFRMKQSTNAMNVKANYKLLSFVLFFVSLIRSQNKFLTKRFDLNVTMYSDKDHTLRET